MVRRKNERFKTTATSSKSIIQRASQRNLYQLITDVQFFGFDVHEESYTDGEDSS